jgi:hypothetical protein
VLATSCLLLHADKTSIVQLFPGKMKGLAFIQDPDGYWIEVLNSDNLIKITK